MMNLEEIWESDITEYSSIVIKYESDKGGGKYKRFPIPDSGFDLIFRKVQLVNSKIKRY